MQLESPRSLSFPPLTFHSHKEEREKTEKREDEYRIVGGLAWNGVPPPMMTTLCLLLLSKTETLKKENPDLQI
ncbi:unnamed protein product [Camellia sinensis]